MTYVDMLESLRTDPNVTTEDIDSLVNASILVRGPDDQLLWSGDNHTDDQMTVEVKALIDSLYDKYNP
jgi:hypothetical protein